MSIVVSGSRRWRDQGAVDRFLQSLPAGTTVIEGGASGLDTMVRRTILDQGYNLHVVTFWANWNWLGKAAGSERNSRMLEPLLAPELAGIFPLPESKGTWDMNHKAEKAGLTVVRGDRLPPP